MNKNQEAISVRLLTADLTDWVLKDFINQYKTALKEVVVLPSAIRRAKILAQGSSLQIGAVIDYPLAQGTLAKVAFEIGRAFMEGADFLEVWLPASSFMENDRGFAELTETIRSLTLTGGEIRLAVQTKIMNELTKIQVAQRLKEEAWPKIVLGQKQPLAEALHDVSLFSLDGGSQLSIQINPDTIDEQAMQSLQAAGAEKIGLSYHVFEELLKDKPAPDVL